MQIVLIFFSVTILILAAKNGLNMHKSNPKKTKDEKRKRKVSLPINKTQSRICIDELRKNFKRQMSLPTDHLYDPTEKVSKRISL